MTNIDNDINNLVTKKILELKGIIHEIEIASTRGDSDSEILDLIIHLSGKAIQLEPLKSQVLDKYPDLKDLLHALFLFNAQLRFIEAQYNTLREDADKITQYIEKVYSND